jgi:5-methylthioadenosine/S-adenosylhomocysteine deaminase
MPACRISAKWLLPMDGGPIPWGAVLIGADGRLAAVGADADVPRPPGLPEQRFPGAALLPGLVNAHTHLELTGLDGQAPDGDFSDWIARIIALKRARTPADFLEAARQGLAACHAAGVTTVADTGDSGAAIQAMHEAGGSGVAYLEVFGPEPDRAEPQMLDLQARVAAHRPFQGPRVRLGVSPHAPYSVSGELYATVACWAGTEGLPVAVHLAESAAETELLASGQGAFARQWERRGIPPPPGPGRTPVAWLDRHGVLGERTLCIHLVRVNASDIDTLRRTGCGVAHCPRSNARHGHGDAPLAALRAAGLRIGVGTDSVASVSPPDLLAEARAACRLDRLNSEQALQLCTMGAARAINLDTEVGSLTPGKWGDAAVIRLPKGSGGTGAMDAALNSSLEDVVATYLGGKRVWRRSD